MESYSKRNNLLQHQAQTAFRRIMDGAAADAGLDRIDWLIQQAGDGELAILPTGTSERTVAAKLAPAADRRLREHNQGLRKEAKVRLRLAVHQGLVHLDGANGFPSDAVIHVCRLVDSPELKRALRRFSGADVALIVSDSMYHEVIEHYRDLRPEQFKAVRAEIPDKRFSAAAWIYVPGENAAGDATDEAAYGMPATSPAEATAAPRPTDPIGQVFSGITTHGPAQFGNQNTMRNSNE